MNSDDEYGYDDAGAYAGPDESHAEDADDGNIGDDGHNDPDTFHAPAPKPETGSQFAGVEGLPKAEKDKIIIAAAKDGDEKAFEVLMRNYQKSVYYLALKMVRSPEDAEDLTQESFAKAFASIQNFDAKFAFSTWLFRIATNSCIDHIRRKRLQTLSIDGGMKSEDGASMVLQIEDSEYTPYERFLKEQRKEYLNLAMKRLPERYQRLVDLRYYKEYSYEEVAEELMLPLGTVKAQLHRARELLNQELSALEGNL